ncbi:MAG: hypothetical protein N2253_05015 [Bacteroidia bacterium]|nr:hypothetical protein [Bacteroidia bacterium]MCX7764236.1 hypothetical protein [Bacteroidia bacterium]MDW8056913.1 hypothetical protein [Bacteroidia bacterium]
MRWWIFASLTVFSLSAQPLLRVADSLPKERRYRGALVLYDSLLRSQSMPDALRLRVYLRGAEAWGGGE